MSQLPSVHEDFGSTLSPHWQRLVVGNGSLEPTGSTLRLVNTDTSSRCYTNAQIDDYQHRARRDFLWRPPLTLTVRARFSHLAPTIHNDERCVGAYHQRGRSSGQILSGTAGFGFWNDPFMMTCARLPTLPRVIWFFYSSPSSNMKLDVHTPGCGWKAATMDAMRLPFLLLAPTAPVAVPLMNIRPLYHKLWPIAQRAIGVCEAAVDVTMTDWHTYVIEWGTRSAHFSVDGTLILECKKPPPGPLGLVIWLDNQYMVATPWGRFRHGWLQTPGRQWMELDMVAIEPANISLS
jgi:hypothetical protein